MNLAEVESAVFVFTIKWNKTSQKQKLWMICQGLFGVISEGGAASHSLIVTLFVVMNDFTWFPSNCCDIVTDAHRTTRIATFLLFAR